MSQFTITPSRGFGKKPGTRLLGVSTTVDLLFQIISKVSWSFTVFHHRNLKSLMDYAPIAISWIIFDEVSHRKNLMKCSLFQITLGKYGELLDDF